MPNPKRLNRLVENVEDCDVVFAPSWMKTGEKHRKENRIRSSVEATDLESEYMLHAYVADNVWVESFGQAAKQFAKLSETRRRQFARFDAVVQDLAELRLKLADLSKANWFLATITTLAPEPLRLLRDIPVTVARVDEEFTATFYDAGISASGDNEQEAVYNLKDMICQTYFLFASTPSNLLGEMPKRQLAVLRTVINSAE